MKHQILIASYHKDFNWLRQCLRSLAKFSTGFLTPVIAVPGDDVDAAEDVTKGAKIGVVKAWDGPGFGRAQHAMMCGDELCPYTDYVWLLGSDCLAVEPFTPETYCGPNGLPFMLYNSWNHMRKHCPPTLHWKPGVEKALGWESQGEFMRRLPLAYPVTMLPALREFIQRRHGISFRDYVLRSVNTERNFSESNVMGEWAYRMAHDAYNWVNMDKPPAGFVPWPKNPIVQHWSHGGFDRPRDQDGRTPRSVMVDVLGSL
jgi:hypothetical protein